MSFRKIKYCLFALFFNVLALPVGMATVYESVPTKESATEAIDSGLNDKQGGFRKYILNGQKLDGRLSHSVYTPNELVSVLSQDWQDKYSKVLSENESDIPELGVGKPFVSNGENWSMFANLNLLGRSEEALTQPTLAERYIVFAMRSDQKSNTDVWILNIPDDVNPLSLMVPASSGGDVPVYPGNKLAWSLVEATSSGESELHIYSGPGTISEYTEHYRRAYISRGFDYDASLPIESESDGMRVLFSRGRSELDVTMQLDGQGVVSIIQFRKKR